MIKSILTSTKKVLGLDEDYEAFDEDIMIHINSVFAILNQLGIGSPNGFMIEDKTAEWADFFSDGITEPVVDPFAKDPRLSSVKTYMYLRVRMLFDPPTTSYLITSMTEQLKELEWRLNVHREDTAWRDPNPQALSEEQSLPPQL